MDSEGNEMDMLILGLCWTGLVWGIALVALGGFLSREVSLLWGFPTFLLGVPFGMFSGVVMTNEYDWSWMALSGFGAFILLLFGGLARFKRSSAGRVEA